MDKLLAYVAAHQLAFGYLLSTAITILVSPLPKPDASSSKFYAYFYGVSQAVAGVVHSRPPATQYVLPAVEIAPQATITPKAGWVPPV